MKTIERLAHTLKGVSGTIGANAVMTAAAHLEDACRQNQEAPTVALLFTVTLEALQPVLDELGTLPSDAIVSTDRRKFDQQLCVELRTQLAKLGMLLELGDSDSLEYAEKIASLTLNSSLHTAATTLLDGVAGFDFDEAKTALATLEALLSSLEQDQVAAPS